MLQNFRDVFFLEVLGAAGSATHTHSAGTPRSRQKYIKYYKESGTNNNTQ